MYQETEPIIFYLSEQTFSKYSKLLQDQQKKQPRKRESHEDKDGRKPERRKYSMYYLQLEVPEAGDLLEGRGQVQRGDSQGRVERLQIGIEIGTRDGR